MSIILLRTLTKKSVIQQGKNKGLLVGEVLKKCKLDLIYAYFNYANLSFTEDILEELNIKAEDKIQKPGKSPEKFEFYADRNIYLVAKNKLRLQGKDDSQIAVSGVKKCIKKSRMKAKEIRFLMAERHIFSKGAMQWRNHHSGGR